MNKRGQFFIIAAIIIVSAIAGLTGVANYVETEGNQKAFYDLAEEVGYEGRRVLDWGTFNEEDVDSLTQGFLANYSNYIGEEDVIFIYGDRDGILIGGSASDFQALVFEEEGVGSVLLNTGYNRGIEINKRSGKKADVELVTQGRGRENSVEVVVDENNYEFDLKEGQNFFFVIKRERGDETFVAKG